MDVYTLYNHIGLSKIIFDGVDGDPIRMMMPPAVQRICVIVGSS